MGNNLYVSDTVFKYINSFAINPRANLQFIDELNKELEIILKHYIKYSQLFNSITR